MAYRLWLGYYKWNLPPLELSGIDGEHGTTRKFWEVALFNLTNPKATASMLALFPLFIDPQLPKIPQFMIMGTVLITVDMLVMTGYATLSSYVSTWLSGREHQLLLHRLFGSLFIGAAALMAGYHRI